MGPHFQTYPRRVQRLATFSLLWVKLGNRWRPWQTRTPGPGLPWGPTGAHRGLRQHSGTQAPPGQRGLTTRDPRRAGLCARVPQRPPGEGGDQAPGTRTRAPPHTAQGASACRPSARPTHGRLGRGKSPREPPSVWPRHRAHELHCWRKNVLDSAGAQRPLPGPPGPRPPALLCEQTTRIMSYKEQTQKIYINK